MSDEINCSTPDGAQASIDLAQLDKIETEAKGILGYLDKDYKGCVREAVGNILEAVALARRSRTSGAPADLLNAEELAALRRFDECAQDGEGYDVPKAMMQRLAEIGVVQRRSGAYYQATEFGVRVLAAPVHDAAAPSAELIDLLKAIRPNYGAVGSRDVDVTAQRNRIDRAIELLSAGAAAKTDHAPKFDGQSIEPLLKSWFGLDDCKGLFNPGRLLAFANDAIVKSASAAGAGSDQALAKTKIHLWWRQDHAEWRECMPDAPGAVEFSGVVPAGYAGVLSPSAPSVTVQDERARIKTWQERQAEQRFAYPERDHMLAEITDLRAAHPVQDGEKDAKGGAA